MRSGEEGNIWGWHLIAVAYFCSLFSLWKVKYGETLSLIIEIRQNIT
jgi:hypothetical protein